MAWHVMEVGERAAGNAEVALLPQLRAELRIIADSDGSGRGGVLYDPLRGRYFQIDQDTVELLSLWPYQRTVGQLAKAAGMRLGLYITAREIQGLVQFIVQNELAEVRREEDWRRFVDAQRRSRRGWLMSAADSYVFLRVPLVSPDAFLKRALPYLEPLFSKWMLCLTLLSGLLGLYLVSRQWEQFLATFPHLFSMEGAVLVAVCLIIVMAMHELGHAVTAARYGCRVPAIGVCFIVLIPLLYTDVTDAWRLGSRRQRAAIDGAGMGVELALACFATLAWSFLPEGALQTVAFVIATTGWILSLGLNLNPFMRFDGYYLLSDLVGIDNLQPRAFALGRWQIRRTLFGIEDPSPEHFSSATTRMLIVYAWATWLYRLVIFTGIALLVYHMTFKVLGVVLFILEIWYFILKPIWREIREWWDMRNTLLASRRTLVTLGILAVLVAMLLVPWSGTVSIPAVLEDEEMQLVYPGRAARVAEVRVLRGARITAGEALVRLQSPELEHDIDRTREQIKQLTWRLARQAADAIDRAQSLVLKDQLQALVAKLEGLEKEKSELDVVARHDGVVAEMDVDLSAGQWVQTTDLIALLCGGKSAVLRGYVAEEDVPRIDHSAQGVFIPEDLLQGRLDIAIESVSAAGSSAIAIHDLVSHYGGAIAARGPRRPGSEHGSEHAPIAGQFLVRGRPLVVQAVRRRMRGTLLARGKAESLASRGARQVLKVLIRESGV